MVRECSSRDPFCPVKWRENSTEQLPPYSQSQCRLAEGNWLKEICDETRILYLSHSSLKVSLQILDNILQIYISNYFTSENVASNESVVKYTNMAKK